MSQPSLLLADTPDSVISVSAKHALNTVSPLMYGSCIEDVNHEIYGGLYDQKIFGESFEEPPAAQHVNGWTTFGGDWQVSDGICNVHAENGAKLVRDTPEFGDAAVDVDVRFANTSGDNAGLVLRVHDPGVGADNFDGYELSLSQQGQAILGKHLHDWHPISSVPLLVPANQWIHMHVVLTGARIQLFVDGADKAVIDYTDPDHPLMLGQVALRTWNSDVSFRNFHIAAGQTAYDSQFPAAGDRPDSVSNCWDPIATGAAQASFQQDPNQPFNGKFSQMIRHGNGAGIVGIANSGLGRWGIAVEKGHVYDGRVYLRALDLQGPVTVALQSADGAQTYATQSFPQVTADWLKYPFALRSKTTDPNARFALWIDRPGAVWVDQAVLMDSPQDRFHGLPVRKDIADAMAAEGLTMLRYGGTMVNAPEYRWKNMVGDPDKRPPYRGHWYPFSTNGFGILDFLNFCGAAGLRPAFAINIEESDQDAADLADYLTGSASTVWGRKRADDGHPAPYDVQYVEIGNEEVIGDDNAADYAHYAGRFKAIAAAMHGRAPNLKLVCAAWWRPDSANVKSVFDAIDGVAAAWDLHVWSDGARAGDDIDHQLTEMQSRFLQWNPNTSMKAVIFEENGGLHNMQRALGHATTLYATFRHSDFVLADCPANCLQALAHNDNGWDQGQIFYTPSRVWGQPPYFAQQMASSAAAHPQQRVESTVTSPGNDLYVTATTSLDGNTLALSVVNTSGASHTATVDLHDFTPGRQYTCTTLSGQLNDTNGPDQRIRPAQSVNPISSAHFSQKFPAYSFATLTFHAK
jgi:alpha-L-arabinofuranosidase